jgi:ABC-type uncharacterized transport system permease subunit
MSSRTYLLLSLALYAVGALQVLAYSLTRRRLLSSLTLPATLLGFALHTAGLSQRWTESGRFPAVGLHDASSLLAWAIVAAFLLTLLRTRAVALGLFAYPAAFALLLVSNLAPVTERADPILMSLYLPVHATLAFFGYGALFVAFAMGGLYLFQERELKSRAPAAFYYLAPSLERCDSISGRSVTVGFVFLTLAIVTGVLWSEQARGRPFTGDAKEWSALLAWVIYVVLIVARLRTGWGGRRAALLGLAGFASVAFTFLWMTLGGSGAKAP